MNTSSDIVVLLRTCGTALWRVGQLRTLVRCGGAPTASRHPVPPPCGPPQKKVDSALSCPFSLTNISKYW